MSALRLAFFAVLLALALPGAAAEPDHWARIASAVAAEIAKAEAMAVEGHAEEAKNPTRDVPIAPPARGPKPTVPAEAGPLAQGVPEAVVPVFRALESTPELARPTGRALADLYYSQGHYAEALQIYDDLVSRRKRRRDEAPRHQVDGLGRAADEDDLPVLARAEEAAHLLPRALELRRRPLGELVQPAVHRGAVVGVEARDGVDHGARLLARRRAVQVDERPAVDRAPEDREVLPDTRDVDHARPARARSRSTNFVTLPEALSGSASTISTDRGTL